MKRAAIVLLAAAAAACRSDSSSTGGAGSAPAGMPAGDAARGKTAYAINCSTCHGDQGEGVKGLGKPLAGNDFVKRASDADLAALVKQGRSASDPANSTGIAMPARGGNPSLDDADIADIVAFVKTLGR
jgi:disulfide bond formation protein DsbB